MDRNLGYLLIKDEDTQVVHDGAIPLLIILRVA
jgi:hypothetical protein